ncbi:hypothetical protein Tco_0609499 [Tanacetum coccineum]
MVLQLTDFTSEITDEELREFTSEYYIPFALHPVVPAASASIADFPEGKVGVYTRFFEFANQRVPLSLFMLCSSFLDGFHFDKMHMYCDSKASISISGLSSLALSHEDTLMSDVTLSRNWYEMLESSANWEFLENVSA